MCTFIAVLFGLLNHVKKNQITFFQKKGSGGEQPAKLINFLWLAPSSSASSGSAAYVLPLSNFHQGWNLSSLFWNALHSGWIIGLAKAGGPWSVVWLDRWPALGSFWWCSFLRGALGTCSVLVELCFTYHVQGIPIHYLFSQMRGRPWRPIRWYLGVGCCHQSTCSSTWRAAAVVSKKLLVKVATTVGWIAHVAAT